MSKIIFHHQILSRLCANEDDIIMFCEGRSRQQVGLQDKVNVTIHTRVLATDHFIYHLFIFSFSFQAHPPSCCWLPLYALSIYFPLTIFTFSFCRCLHISTMLDSLYFVFHCLCLFLYTTSKIRARLLLLPESGSAIDLLREFVLPTACRCLLVYK